MIFLSNTIGNLKQVKLFHLTPRGNVLSLFCGQHICSLACNLEVTQLKLWWQGLIGIQAYLKSLNICTCILVSYLCLMNVPYSFSM